MCFPSYYYTRKIFKVHVSSNMRNPNLSRKKPHYFAMFGGIDQVEIRPLLSVKRLNLLSEKKLMYLKNVMYIISLLFMQTNILQTANDHMEFREKIIRCTRWNNLMS